MIKVHGEVFDTGTTWTEVVEFMRVGRITIKCFQKNGLI